MKKTIFLFVVGVLFTSLTHQIEAHVLESTDTVGAVLHISPNDDPIAGTQTELLFEVNDISKTFDPTKCNCVVMIQKGESIVSATLLSGYNTSGDSSTLKFTVVFPEMDVYSVSLIANPFDNRDFIPFQLNYEVRVARQESTPDPQEIELKKNILQGIALTLLFSILLLLLIAIKKFVFQKSKNSNYK